MDGFGVFEPVWVGGGIFECAVARSRYDDVAIEQCLTVDLANEC